MKAGWSKTFRYLRKYQRISLSGLGDCYQDESRWVAHVESRLNSADMLTKALGAELFKRHCLFLGLRHSSLG